MAESAHAEITIDAPLPRVFDVLVDFERYPEWVADLKHASVVATDDEGRSTEVEFRAAAMGRSTTYRLGYDYADAPNRLGWFLVEGDLERELDGNYHLEEGDGGEGTTKVTYELSIDLIVPIPGFVKRRAETRIVKAALEDLKAYVQSCP
jgi:uncharacterized protein YndB with AHSA1/START domain